MTHPALKAVPNSLLLRKATPRGERTRARKLVAWLNRAQARVTLLDVDLERRARTSTTSRSH